MNTAQLPLFTPTPPTPPKTWMRVHRRNTGFTTIMDLALTYYREQYHHTPSIIRISAKQSATAEKYLKDNNLTTITLLKCPGGLLNCEVDLPYWEGVG